MLEIFVMKIRILFEKAFICFEFVSIDIWGKYFDSENFFFGSIQFMEDNSQKYSLIICSGGSSS